MTEKTGSGYENIYPKTLGSLVERNVSNAISLGGVDASLYLKKNELCTYQNLNGYVNTLATFKEKTNTGVGSSNDYQKLFVVSKIEKETNIGASISSNRILLLTTAGDRIGLNTAFSSPTGYILMDREQNKKTNTTYREVRAVYIGTSVCYLCYKNFKTWFSSSPDGNNKISPIYYYYTFEKISEEKIIQSASPVTINYFINETQAYISTTSVL